MPDTKHATTSISGGDWRKRPFVTYCLYSLLFLVSFLYVFNAFGRDYYPLHQLSGQSETDATLDWEMVKPTSELEWHPCARNRECARLEVPLDYDDPTGEKAAIAMVRVKAKVSPKSEKYRGPVLFNPGGPGGSGTSMINGLGESFQKLLGEEYDIVGFDPRGVGLTTPPVSSFLDPVERAFWNSEATPLVNSTSDSFIRAYTRSVLLGSLTAKRSKHAAEYVSTASVARDMLTITRAHGRDKLLYWGFSYGTVLGATYAALFPDNIERLVIDGVVDFYDYYSGGWSRNLFDTDKILQFFYDECSSAGTACPLYANTSTMVQQRVESIFASIKSTPLPVIDDTGLSYGIVDYSKIKSALFRALYKPFAMLPEYGHVLAALEAGDGRPALMLWQQSHSEPKCTDKPTLPSDRVEAGIAISCGEGEMALQNPAEIVNYFNDLSKISVFADVWTQLTSIECSGWKIKVKDRFAGSFNTTTSFPLLIIGNTFDPVTPLIGAKKAAHGFEGSVLLTVDTPGHCSLTATSPSAMQHIRRYFRDGILPPPGTICEIENKLFGSPKEGFQVITAEDQDILDATRLLSDRFHNFQRGLPL